MSWTTAARPLMVSAARERRSRRAPSIPGLPEVHSVHAEDRNAARLQALGQGVARSSHGAHDVDPELAEDPRHPGQGSGRSGMTTSRRLPGSCAPMR